MHNVTAESLIQVVSLTVVFNVITQRYSLFGVKHLHDNPKMLEGRGGITQ